MVRFPPLNSSRPPRNEEGHRPGASCSHFPSPNRGSRTETPPHAGARSTLKAACASRAAGETEMRRKEVRSVSGSKGPLHGTAHAQSVTLSSSRQSVNAHTGSVSSSPLEPRLATAHLGLFRTPNPVVLGSRGQLCLAVPRPCTFRSWRLYESSSPCLPLCHGASPRLTERMSSPTRSP